MRHRRSTAPELVQGRVNGLGREMIESFKEEKDEDDDEDHTNASKCVASGTERTREDTGRKDEQEDEALLLLLHWIELVESRTSRGSQRKRRRTTTTTATRCGTVPGGVGVAPLTASFLHCGSCCCCRCCAAATFFVTTQFILFFLLGSFQKDLIWKRLRKFAQSDQLYYELVTFQSL